MWYHGTPVEFETFEDRFLGKGHDQLGSGFYFTDNFDTAAGYAAMRMEDGRDGQPTVLGVELLLSNPIPKEGGISPIQIEAILRSSPDFDDMIQNFGDVGWDGEEKVLTSAVETYGRIIEGDTLQGLHSISNDFFQGEEAKFLRSVRVFTNYDGVLHPIDGETHAVVWEPSQITIKSRMIIDPPSGPKI